MTAFSLHTQAFHSPWVQVSSGAGQGKLSSLVLVSCCRHLPGNDRPDSSVSPASPHSCFISGPFACIEWCVKYLHHTSLSICLHVTLGFYCLPCRFYSSAVPLSFWQSQLPLKLCHALYPTLFYGSLLLPQAVCFLEATRVCLTLWPDRPGSYFQVTSVGYFLGYSAFPINLLVCVWWWWWGFHAISSSSEQPGLRRR